MSYASLDDALASGRGIERPFCCPMHGDTNASASVNVVKGVWCCYACKATGTVDGKRAPSASDLAAMLGRTDGARIYPAAWLDLFDPEDAYEDHYWASRFPFWVRRAMHLGQDPFTGEATFPVYTPGGRELAGVGRRRPDPDSEARYHYPYSWAASQSFSCLDMGTLGGAELNRNVEVARVLVLTEGAADAAAITEVGARALGCYGSGLHQPQREILARLAPKLILLAFDNDEAGNTSIAPTIKLIDHIAPVEVVSWPTGGDPAAVSPAERTERLIDAVVAQRYRAGKQLINGWAKTAAALSKAYEGAT